MSDSLSNPDYLFEVSWEVSNKIGGIHTVISTKALTLSKVFGDKYICVGPEVLKEPFDTQEFVEDKYLFRSWREKAQEDNLNIRIGRWNIPGEPVTILVDFTRLFSEKDTIFSDFWLKFGVNSLHGQWDYTEPVMFGYAAGQVIEHFYEYYFSSRERFVANFHEWMTGSGVLYLNDKVPQAATIFTTHSNILGRSISNHGIPFYKEMKSLNPESKAEELNVTSKHSMEKQSAKYADAFATVSDITNYECKILLDKEADIVTPNGFENDFVPKGEEFYLKKSNSRKQLLKVAEGLMNQKLADDSLLIAHSGRYEFKNKGIDLFIDSLKNINQSNPDKDVIAFIMIPANQTGVRPEVVDRMNNPDMNNPLSGEIVTHNLADEDTDIILKSLKQANLNNNPDNKVKVVFVPAYLNGNDGIFDINYYDILIGFDITVFPSYYEPWGYTPLESIAFKVPTITTILSGFGEFVKSNFGNVDDAVFVIDRNDDNYNEASAQIAEKLIELTKKQESGKPLFNKINKDSLIYVIEDNDSSNGFVKEELKNLEFKNIKSFKLGDNWQEHLSKNPEAVIYNCINISEEHKNIDFLYETKNANPDLNILFITTNQDLQKALEAVNKGICYYVIETQRDLHDEVKYLLENITSENIVKSHYRAYIISCSLLWKNLISKYYNAFDMALEKVDERKELFKDKKPPVKTAEIQTKRKYRPKWKKILVEINVPDKLKELETLSKNIWWTWNYEAEELFEYIDPELWERCEKNPVRLLEKLTYEHYETVMSDENFMKLYSKVVEKFHKYMEEGKKKSGEQIAYFSMEYGLHETIKIYSGGLGVLAGDYLKQASDDNVNIIGVGLLYRYGYFTQKLSMHGEQDSKYYPHNFTYMSATPVRNEAGSWIKVKIGLPGRILTAKVWKVDVGRVPLYLLDTDLAENSSVDRFITHQLYGGDWENRFKQEFLLGIGGIRLLDALGLKPDIHHCNEGHAAFTGLERLRKYTQDKKLTFYEALEIIKASSLFTTHTPVPAGHDFFSEDMLRTYMSHYPERLGITWEKFMSLGRMNYDDPDESFSMSVLAAKLAQEVNGVSRIHGEVSREMFKDLYQGYFYNELHIGHVTNGVHYLTWTAKEWQGLYNKSFGEGFINDCSNPKYWEKIYDVPDEKIWQIRSYQRKLMFEYIRNRVMSNLSERQESPKKIYKIIDALDESALTIGFARRFVTYKRANLLFNDPEKFASIVNQDNKPVLFIFAGKAHPADKAGQELIKNIVEYSRKEEFRGKVIFLEDYDMELARYLVQGVDIWFNTPTRPLEASGTSGQKAALNGVLNFSVLDGWWAEGYVPEAGWGIKEERTFDNQALQDELDAANIYNLLENEIIPMFFDRDDEQIPREWIKWVKNNIAKVAPHFTNKRMLDDYIQHFYSRNLKYSKTLTAKNYAKAKELSSWKNQIARSWDSVEVKSIDVVNTSDNSLLLGENFIAEITLDLKELSPDDVGLEAVFLQKSFEEEDEVYSIHSMEKVKTENNHNNHVTFKLDVPAKRAGVYNYAFRMFPKHELLAHRQDFPLVRWF